VPKLVEIVGKLTNDEANFPKFSKILKQTFIQLFIFENASLHYVFTLPNVSKLVKIVGKLTRCSKFSKIFQNFETDIYPVIYFQKSQVSTTSLRFLMCQS
jgi:hypothetical protein